MSKNDGLAAMRERLKGNDNATSINITPNPERPRRGSFANITRNEATASAPVMPAPVRSPKSTSDVLDSFNVPKRTSSAQPLDFTNTSSRQTEEANKELQKIIEAKEKLKTDLENMKLVLYHAINIKYDNVNVLSSDGRKLSTEFSTYLDSLKNRTFSVEFNHLQAELLEYRYNMKLKEDAEKVLKSEIGSLQETISSEQLKNQELERYISEIKEETDGLVGAHQDMKNLYLKERDDLKKELLSLKSYQSQILKANEEYIKNITDYYCEQIETNQQASDKMITTLQVEIRKLQSESTKQRKEYEEQLALKDKQINHLRFYLGESTEILPPHNVVQSSPKINLGYFKNSINEFFKKLDDSINSLYNPSHHRANYELLDTIQTTNNYNSIQAPIYIPVRSSSDSSFNDDPVSIFADVEVANPQGGELVSNNFNNKNANDNFSIEDIIKKGDIIGLEKLGLAPEYRARALSLFTIKRVINDRYNKIQQKHNEKLDIINNKIKEVEEKIKQIKYSIFKLNNNGFQQTLADSSFSKLELHFEMDIRKEELNRLKEEKQILKQNHLVYLEVRDKQLNRLSYEEERIISSIK